MKVKKRNIVLIFILMFLIFQVLSIFHAYSFTHPVKYSDEWKPKSTKLSLKQLALVTVFGFKPYSKVNGILPSDVGLKYENVSFKSRDGLMLKGLLIKTNKSKGMIILAHGWEGNKEGLLNYSKFLARNSYEVLIFDFRGFGESEGGYSSLGYYERFDVLDAIDYIKSRKDLNSDFIGGLGFSMGGASMLMTIKDSQVFDALVIDSVYPTIHQNVGRRFNTVYGFPKFPFATSLVFWGGIINGFNGFDLAPEKYIAEAKFPIFIIQGTEDYQVSIGDANLLFNKAQEPKQMWIVNGSKHTGAFLDYPNLYENKVICFFDTYSK